VRAGTTNARDQFGIAIDATEALDAGNIRVWAGDAARAQVSDADFGRAVDDLSYMAAACARRDLTISVEFHRRTLTEHAHDAVRTLSERFARLSLDLERRGRRPPATFTRCDVLGSADGKSATNRSLAASRNRLS